jgi:hypothetical protein
MCKKEREGIRHFSCVLQDHERYGDLEDIGEITLEMRDAVKLEPKEEPADDSDEYHLCDSAFIFVCVALRACHATCHASLTNPTHACMHDHVVRQFQGTQANRNSSVQLKHSLFRH